MPDLTQYRKDMEKFRRAARLCREVDDEDGVSHFSIMLMAAAGYAALVWAGAPLPPGESRSLEEIAQDVDRYLVAPGHLPRYLGQWLHENVELADLVEWRPLELTPETAELLYTRGESVFAAVDALLRREGP